MNEQNQQYRFFPQADEEKANNQQRLDEAMAAYRAGNYLAAIEGLTAYIKLSLDKGEYPPEGIQYNLASAYRESGQIEKAWERFFFLLGVQDEVVRTAYSENRCSIHAKEAEKSLIKYLTRTVELALEYPDLSCHRLSKPQNAVVVIKNIYNNCDLKDLILEQKIRDLEALVRPENNQSNRCALM
jgi:hypothetical protein